MPLLSKSLVLLDPNNKMYLITSKTSFNDLKWLVKLDILASICSNWMQSKLNGIWANLVNNFEDHAQRVSNNGGLRVLALIIGNPHDHVRRVNQRLLVQRGSNLTGDLEIDLVWDGLVGQVILAGDGEAEIAWGDNPVVMLDDDVIGVAAGSFPPDAAVNVIVAESDGEFELAVYVFHARLGATLGVDLSVEESGGKNVGNHVAGVALDAHVVAGGQLVGRGFLNGQIGFFNLEWEW